MSTQAAKTAPVPAPKPLTVDDLKALKSRHRPRFSKEQVIRALQYQRDHNCTLDVAAATEGMTGQTLAARRDQLAKEMGVSETEGAVPEVSVPAKPQAAKPSPKKR